MLWKFDPCLMYADAPGRQGHLGMSAQLELRSSKTCFVELLPMFGRGLHNHP